MVGYGPGLHEAFPADRELPMDEKPINILLVEDEKTHVRLIQRAFESRAGEVRLTVAGTLQEGRALLAQSLPDLVIADLFLPDGKGTELLPADKVECRFPIVLMTSHGSEQMAVEAMKAGALGYVVKSDATLSDMARTAEQALRQWKQVTQRKRAEENLRRSESELSAIYENAPLVMMLVDRERRIVKLNASALSMARRSAEEAIGLRGGEALRCVHASDDSKGCGFGPACEACGVRNTVLRTFQSGRAFHRLEASIPYDHTDGPVDMHVLVSTTPLSVSEEDLVLVCLEDITERKRAEDALRQSEILRAEAEKLAATGRMAARVAHEIGNPLAGIKAAFQVVKKAIPEDYPRYKHVGRIEKEIERIQLIVRQMIHLHRAEREADSNVSIRETVGDVVAMLQPICRKHEVSVEVDTESCQDVVKLWENGLRQVLYALLVNGIEASPEGEVVRVQAVADQRTVQITVADQGSGIAEQLGDRIFEPFFTTKGSEVTGGLGLGLPIARGIVEAWGGTLDFESQPEQGCVFRIVLPRGDADESSNSNPPGANPDCG